MTAPFRLGELFHREVNMDRKKLTTTKQVQVAESHPLIDQLLGSIASSASSPAHRRMKEVFQTTYKISDRFVRFSSGQAIDEARSFGRSASFLTDPVENLNKAVRSFVEGELDYIEIRESAEIGSKEIDDAVTMALSERPMFTINLNFPIKEIIDGLKKYADELERSYASNHDEKFSDVLLEHGKCLDKIPAGYVIHNYKDMWESFKWMQDPNGGGTDLVKQRIIELLVRKRDNTCTNSIMKLGLCVQSEWVVWRDGDYQKPPPRPMEPFTEFTYKTKCLFGRPMDVRITSDYGWRTLDGKNQFHIGTDFGVPASTQVYFGGSDGLVEYILTSDNQEQGVIVKLMLDGKYYGTLQYWHIAPSSSLKVGDKISQGTLLGAVYPYSKSHLHLAMYHFPDDGSWINDGEKRKEYATSVLEDPFVDDCENLLP